MKVYVALVIGGQQWKFCLLRRPGNNSSSIRTSIKKFFCFSYKMALLLFIFCVIFLSLAQMFVFSIFKPSLYSFCFISQKKHQFVHLRPIRAQQAITWPRKVPHRRFEPPTWSFPRFSEETQSTVARLDKLFFYFLFVLLSIKNAERVKIC